MRSSLRTHLRYQVEAFFIAIFLAAAENIGASNPGTLVALECLVRVCSMPQLLTDIFCSFDCDRRHLDVFETLCKSLAKVRCVSVPPLPDSVFCLCSAWWR